MINLAAAVVLSNATVDCRGLENYNHVNVCEVTLVEIPPEGEQVFVVCERGLDYCLVLPPSEFPLYYNLHLKEYEN